MKKRFMLLMPLLAAAPLCWGQEPVDSAEVAEYEELDAYIFTDLELDDDAPASQNASSLASYNDDLFMSKTNFRFGHSYFSPRNYEQPYRSMFVNGASVNNLERGTARFGTLFGGLSNVTTNQQGMTTYEQNMINYTDIAGGSNINLRPSQFATGSRLSMALTNRNYIGRVMFTHATGIRNGWAFVTSANIRYGEEGNMKGTYMHSGALFLGAEKVFSDQHHLSLSLLAAPTDQATSSWTTEEAYWLANSHYYNPFWGYQNGKKRSSRVRKTVEPTAFLTWDWNINRETKLTTTSIFSYIRYGQTYINRTNNAADPRPDYYHYMPSNVFNVYSGTAPNDWEYAEWLNYVNYWLGGIENRQINWDKMYMINQNSVNSGGEAVYYLEESRSDQWAWNFASTFNHAFDRFKHLDVGMNLNHTTGMHFKKMDDLLGANYHTDIDRFASSDYGANSTEAQNDLDNPSRRIREGDKFGYNYNIYVNKAQLWATYTQTDDQLSWILSGNLNGTTIERDGKMRNGRSPEHSKGSSGTASFISGGFKSQLGYTINGHNKFRVGVGYEMRPPLADRAFLNVQTRNAFVFGLQNENVFNSELIYRFDYGKFHAQIGGYFTQFDNCLEQSQFFDDIKQEYSYLSMTDIKKEHYGVEFALQYNFLSNFSIDFVGNIAEAKYSNNADAVICFDKADAKQEPYWWDEIHHQKLQVVTKDMHVGCTPLTALSLGAKYNTNGWYFEARLNYYDRNYIYFSPYLRLTAVMPDVTKTYDSQGNATWSVDKMKGAVLYDETGQNIVGYQPKDQEKFDNAFMLDLSISRNFYLRHGRRFYVGVNLTNVTNNTNMKLRGSEQSRNDDFDKTNKVRAYQFAYNSKYAYAYPFNAFLNLIYRF